MFLNTGEQFSKAFYIPSLQETHPLCSEGFLFHIRIYECGLSVATKPEAISFSLHTLTSQTAFELEVRLKEFGAGQGESVPP